MKPALVFACGLALAGCTQRPEPADLVLLGGKVVYRGEGGQVLH